MKNRLLNAKERKSWLTLAMMLMSLPASQVTAADSPNSRRETPAPTNTAERFGPVEASGLRWLHLSSRHGDLPVPTTSHQQTAALVADLDKDGLNDFVLAFREKGPALVWYRRTKTGWDRYVIEKDYLPIEAGGAVCDIDGDGYPDLVFGGDYQSNQVWWWRNPGKDWKPDVPWERHTIKKTGATQHHDQCFADFKGTGKPQLAFWNQQAKTLFVADIPAHPRTRGMAARNCVLRYRQPGHALHRRHVGLRYRRRRPARVTGVQPHFQIHRKGEMVGHQDRRRRRPHFCRPVHRGC